MGNDVDAEVQAISDVYDRISGFDYVAKKRILNYVKGKIMSEQHRREQEEQDKKDN